MVSESRRDLALMRERDRRKRSLQVWAGLLVVWAVLVGWLAFLAVRSLAPDAGVGVALLAYLIPAAALAVMALLQWKGLRDADAAMLADAQAQRRG